MANKQAVQIGVIVLCLAALPVVMLNQKKEREAKARKLAEQAKKDAEKAAQEAQARAGTAAPATATTAAKTPAQEPKQLGPRDEKALALQKAVAAKDWGRDPFHTVGSVASTSKAGALTLKGIAFRSDGKSFAMVNEAILREGEEIEGNRIVKIERRQITLSREGRQFILRLEEEEAKP